MSQNVYIGQLSPAEKIMAYNAMVEEGFQAPFDRPQDLKYKDIAAVKTPADMGVPAGVVPTKVSFGFSPPNAKANAMGDGGRQARPLSQHSIEVFSTVYESTLSEKRQTFQADVLGVLKKVPRDLRRTESKNPDVLLGALLRNGVASGVDYVGNPFFGTNKPCSPEGAVSNTYNNRYTAMPLNEVNIAAVIQAGMSIVGSDGLVLGVNYDTLVIPPTLFHDAVLSTQLKTIVFGGTNASPGQQAATAAAADNPMAIVLKWIKKIVVLPELQDGQAANNTTWYLMDTGTDGPQSLCYALFEPAEYVSLMDPRDRNVFFDDTYYWGWRKVEGVAYGLPQYAARIEAT